MPVTIAPSDEACQAIVDRINGGSGLSYTLASAATYCYRLNEDIRRLAAMRVDVVHESESDLDEDLGLEQRTMHQIRVAVRQKLPADSNTAAIAALQLVVRQIVNRLKNYGTNRVTVWNCNSEDEEKPDKIVLGQDGVYAGSIALQVIVEVSA